MYNLDAERHINFMNIINFWIVLVGTITYLFPYNLSASLMIGIIFVIPLIAFNQFGRDLMPTVFSHLNLEKGPINNFIGLMALGELSKNSTHLWNCVLMSYLAFHFEVCKVKMCPITVMMAKFRDKGKLSLPEMTQTIYFTINRKLKLAVAEETNRMDYRCFAIGYFLTNTKKWMMITELISSVENIKINAFYRFQLYCFWKDLKISISAQDEKTTLEVSALAAIKHDETQNKICSYIETSATIYERFWDMLADNEPSYEKFLSLGLLIKSLEKRIRVLWKRLKKSENKLSYKMLSIYSSYIESILQEINKSTQLHKLMTMMGVLADGDILLKHAENGDAVVAIYASSQDTGKIKKHNSALCELTGFTKEELYNAPLEMIIPILFRDAHYTKYTNTCFSLQNDQVFDFEQKSVFIQQKSGYILPIIMKIVSSPSLANYYCFMARLTKDKANNEFNIAHIITTPQFIISAVSSSTFFSI